MANPYIGQRGDIAELIAEYGAAGWVGYGDDPDTPRYYTFIADWQNPNARLFTPDDLALAARESSGDGFALGDFSARNWSAYATPATLTDTSRGYFYHPAMAGTGTRCVQIGDLSVTRKGPWQKTWLDKVTYAAAVIMIAGGVAGIAANLAGVTSLGGLGADAAFVGPIEPAVTTGTAATVATTTPVAATVAAPVTAVAASTATTATGTAGFTLAEVAAAAKTTAGIAGSVVTVTQAVSKVSNSGIDWANVAQAAKNSATISSNAEKTKLSLDALTSDPKTLLYIGAAVLVAISL